MLCANSSNFESSCAANVCSEQRSELLKRNVGVDEMQQGIIEGSHPEHGADHGDGNGGASKRGDHAPAYSARKDTKVPV